MKRIHLLLTDADLLALLQYVQSLPADIYSFDAERYEQTILALPQNERSFAVLPEGVVPSLEKVGKRTVIDDQCACISIWHSYADLSNTIQPGFISCPNGSPELASLYKQIEKYIKTSFERSSDKTLYMAPDFYASWLSGAKQTFFLKYREIVVDSCSFCLPDFLVFARQRGFLLEENIRFRDRGKMPLEQSEHLIVFKEGAALFPSKMGFYYTNSDCVFLWRRKTARKDAWHFVIDERLFPQAMVSASAASVFDQIQKYCAALGPVPGQEHA